MSDILEQMQREINELRRQLEAFNSGGYSTLEFVPLTTPLSVTGFNGDSFSDVATSTQMDLSAIASTPAGIKAILMKINVNDSASFPTGGLYFGLGPSDTYWSACMVRPLGGDYVESVLSVIPCDANGDLWYRVNASGVGTLDIATAVYGYWI